MLSKCQKRKQERQDNGKCESLHDAPPWCAAWVAGLTWLRYFPKPPVNFHCNAGYTGSRKLRLNLSTNVTQGELGVGAAALLIFLAGTAWARVIPPNFSSTADDLLDLAVTGACHARLLQLTTLATLERFLKIID